MSKVALSGNALGSGTFTIASPNSNTDRTLNLPDASGTILTTATPGVPVNGPAFSAYQSSGQTISNNVSTKLSFQSEEFDTNSNFDTSTYRFTPTVAGYYQINATVYWLAAATNGQIIQVNKNGSLFKVGTTYNSSSYGLALSALIYMNGSTDYLEAYVYQNSGASATTTSGIAQTYFQGSLVRGA